MIPRDDEYDVYVCEGALVEVWRGEHLSVAQQFGEDWNGPVQSVMHHTVFCPPGAVMAVPQPPPPPECWHCRVWRAVRDVGVSAWLTWGVLVALWLWWARR
jgi:hypothetical protein